MSLLPPSRSSSATPAMIRVILSAVTWSVTEKVPTESTLSLQRTQCGSKGKSVSKRPADNDTLSI